MGFYGSLAVVVFLLGFVAPVVGFAVHSIRSDYHTPAPLRETDRDLDG